MTDNAALLSQLSIRDVSFCYPRAAGPALDHVDATFRSRSIAVLGPNGAGKTTLFRLLTGISVPTTGEVEFGDLRLGERGGREQLKRLVGVMPQHLRMFGGYRCGDFLRYVCWLRQVPAGRVETSVSEALQVVNLSSYADRKIKTLSGGMRQRLGLAQAFVADPKLVVLDEPTVGLDPAQRVDFREYLTALKNRCTVVFATHLVDDVVAVADDLLILSQGRRLYAGPLRDLVEESVDEPLTGSKLEAAYLAIVPRDDR